MELQGDFKAFVSSLEPTARQVGAAKAAQEKVRERLRTDNRSKEAHKDTFLSGSYARRTAINDINDVDVICVVDIDPTITAPEVVLAWMQSILAKYYRQVRSQGRSVGVNAARNVWLDIVPSAVMGYDGGPLWIPDREAHEWVGTHPRGQMAAAVNQNKITNGYYVQVVKLMKSWRDGLPREACRPKSYVLETLVHECIGYPTSHAAAVVNVLEGIDRTYGAFRYANSVPVIPDPGYGSVNVAKRWSSGDFVSFITEVDSASAVARRALGEPDEVKSRRLWRELFGPGFGK